MKVSRFIISFACLSLAIFAIGCAGPSIEVPANSKLLYYGHGGSFNGTRPLGSGRVFLVNETRGNKMAAVMAVSGSQDFTFSNLEPSNMYRIYFEPDPSLMMPGTQPTR